MDKLTIDWNNAFEAKKMDKSKPCRSGYVRLVKFVDGKVHEKPQMYEGDVTMLLPHGGI